MSQELDRIRRLAKAWARMEDTAVAIYKKDDGGYGFTSVSSETGKQIVEYITQY